LKGLEDAVEEQVPDDFAFLEGRNAPDEEIGEHRHGGREQDPSGRHEERDDHDVSAGRLETRRKQLACCIIYARFRESVI